MLRDPGPFGVPCPIPFRRENRPMNPDDLIQQTDMMKLSRQADIAMYESRARSRKQ